MLAFDDVIADEDVNIEGNDGSFAGVMTALVGNALDVADRLVVGALEGALLRARECGERRPALEVLAGALAELGVRPWPASRSARVLREDREAWLRRLASTQRSDAAIAAYRYAIDDLLAWADRHGCDEELFEEHTIVDYLDDYRARCRPAPATYHRRFLLLRRFLRWVARREGLADRSLTCRRRPSLIRSVTGAPRRSSRRSSTRPGARSAHGQGRHDPVFCALAGGRLQPTILANIVAHCAKRAGLSKRVTAHTLRHTAATWLRQATGDARLVAEYLGHADLSTVSLYAHVASDELHAAAQALGDRAAPARTAA
jgi:site-specific recombinase XerD